MPLQVTIDHQQRFVHAAVSGAVKLPEELDYSHRLVVEEAMPYPELFAVAVVAVSDANPAVVRLCVTLSRSVRPVKRFTSVVKAHRWLTAQRLSTSP